MNKLFIMAILLGTLISLPGVSSHGADLTEDVMVISDESNGDLIKKIVEKIGIDVAVYKFTSEDEVNHQLEHMLTNENKRILVLAYQDTANDFLNNNSKLNDRLIIASSNNNESIEDGLYKLTNQENPKDNKTDFITPLIVGLIIGIIIGLGSGILLMKKDD